MNLTFRSMVNWTIAESESSSNSRTIIRNHKVSLTHKIAALQVSVLASCHMMSYVHIYAQHKMEV